MLGCMTKKVLSKCPICGGKLIYSALYQYSLNYGIKSDGTITKSRKKEDIGSMECGFIYCANEECDFMTDCELNSLNHANIEIVQDNGIYYYEDIEED